VDRKVAPQEEIVLPGHSGVVALSSLYGEIQHVVDSDQAVEGEKYQKSPVV
jgi:hypothetical protein